MTEHFIRPDVQAYLDQQAANPRPVFTDELIAMARLMPPEMLAEMLSGMDEPVGELGEIRDVVMPGPGGEIALRLFDPRPSREPGPVVVFYHGGGFIVGSIDTHAAMTAALARGLDLPVISVEYRLAPENRWPAAPDDAEAAARWIAENGGAFGREFTHLVLCGDSAGGTLTLVTALALRDRPAALPLLAQMPLYPRADGTRAYQSGADFSQGFGLDTAQMDYFAEAYRSDHGHWRSSPIVADLAGIAPMLMITAGLDPLRDEGRAYAAKAIEAGVSVAYREYSGTVHGFCTFRKAIPSARDDFASMVTLAREVLAEALRT